ncbi:MAG: TetR family transcriptional regulator [Alphaproteobacteria bacterium]|nr:TetR family transcriptional regulator [Alphaproteobacteria bacterium]
MARTQAADYGERRDAIIGKAAELYAGRGFLGASVADLAEALGMSKSLIYHYYPSKEDILFDVMHSHVRALLDAAEAVVAREGAAADKLDALTHDFMRLYVGAASRHKVLLNELARLPAKQREVVVRIQRRLIDIVEALIAEIRPELKARRPAAMLYFGMINWTHTWLDPDGKVAPAKVASLANAIFLDGLTKAAV